MKSKIYNLIVLDESGSMSCVRNQTLSGCNETINTIRSAQEKYADTQEHFISIYAFQSNEKKPSHYLVKNEPIGRVAAVNAELYVPWGCTPLYDAIGATLTDLKAEVKDKDLAIGNVTIITDGMENSSTHYTCEHVVQMIDALKEVGWSFNFIGANIDVKGTATALHIDNSLEFQQDEKGAQEMFARERNSRMEWLGRTHRVLEETQPLYGAESVKVRAGLFNRLKEAAADYFSSRNDKK